MFYQPSRIARHPLAATGLLILAGCATASLPPTPPSGVCDVAAAQRLVGELKPTDADAMALTGATLVRQISPGDPVTQDLRDNRVTIETDPASGRVVRATCG